MADTPKPSLPPVPLGAKPTTTSGALAPLPSPKRPLTSALKLPSSPPNSSRVEFEIPETTPVAPAKALSNAAARSIDPDDAAARMCNLLTVGSPRGSPKMESVDVRKASLSEPAAESAEARMASLLTSAASAAPAAAESAEARMASLLTPAAPAAPVGADSSETRLASLLSPGEPAKTAVVVPDGAAPLPAILATPADSAASRIWTLLAPPLKLPMAREEAAKKIQRWYLCLARRRRFLIIINRARRRRQFLDERRRITRRLYNNEAEAEEIRARLTQPKGGNMVKQWDEGRQAEAAQRVQSLWRSLKSRRTYFKLLGDQKREQAARKLQKMFRQRSQRRKPNLLKASALENPCALSRPTNADRILKHQEEILAKRKQYHVSMCKDATQEELSKKVQEDFSKFAEELPARLREIGWVVLLKDHTKKLVSALEGRNWESPWEKPFPYGVSSAAILGESSKKHKQRMRSLLEELRFEGGVSSTKADLFAAAVSHVADAMESREEETQADELLVGLESYLGYNFSLTED